MSLQILNAHTGDKVTADPVALRSFEDFKTWLSKITSVPTKNQILLTSAGKQAKFHALRAEQEVFLYNRKLITTANTAADSPQVSTWSSPSYSVLQPAPAPATDQHDPQAWRTLFESRRAWSRELVEKSNALARIADKHFEAVTIIQRGLGVASDNLRNHVRTLETKLSEAKDWAKQTTEEQQDILQSLNDTLTQLSSLPAKHEFGRFLTKLSITNQPPATARASSQDLTLNAFAEPMQITNSADTIRSARQSITDRLDSLDGSVTKISSDANNLIQAVEELQTQSIVDSSNAAWQLMEEIEVVAKKIASDYDHVLTLPPGSTSISQMSKMALLQSRNYLPSLEEFYGEMQDLVDHSVEQRNATAPRSLSNMQSIARVESSFAQVNSQLMGLDLSNDVEQAFDYVSLLSQLPFVYGALLIEAVRRQEWSDKLKQESASLAEDIAEYREEEDRRRKKWYKSLSHLISEDAQDGTNALNFEINLQAAETEWPSASRDDISSYLQALRTIDGVDDVVDELSEAAKELDRPTKKQMKKARGFKMGSFHEAAAGGGSFFLRDNDETRALREAKLKADEELKNQKSRVRRLEEVLYKRDQTSRRDSGNVFQLPEAQRSSSLSIEHASPRPEEPLSRKPSVTSRPSFDVKSSDDQALARRIATLEVELQQEKQKRLNLEAVARSKTDDHARITSEVEESRSTKKDLMENMEAQQLEFAEERKLLEDQVKEYKIRLEELEDDIDRILGSRDNEKTNAEAKLRSLESALADTKTQMGRHQDIQASHLKILQDIRSRLDPEGPEPESTTEILEEVDALVEQSARQTKDLSNSLISAKADKEDLQNSLQAKENDIVAVKAQVVSFEEELATLKNDYAAEKARSESLVSELEDGRTQLRSLRTKFAEGETGSEALRQRVEEQASRASTLATELAESKSHVNSLDVELSSLQRRYQKLQTDAATNTKRLEQRSSRDRELTNRLVSINEDLARLLDSVGLSMVTRDGSFAIQRSSKLATQSASASAATFADPSGITQVDADGISPDTKFIQWMHAPSLEEEESLFNTFYEKISTFDLHTFAEAIIKLRRDVEWTGKKWKQEARNYRDKYHRAQTEAHDKIAFKSFKEGDLALFLPTRNQATRPWAAFNVGAPHFFLRETDAHRLRNREWLVARIAKIEERVVDLSKTMNNASQADASVKAIPAGTQTSAAEPSDGTTIFDDDNPFELSDGLRWYLLDASEEKAGAPATPGLSKSTVASANVDVKGSIRMKKSEKGHDASGKLNKSLESRRSSNNSKRGSISGIPEDILGGGAIPRSSSGTHLRPASRSSAANVPTGAAAGTSSSNNGNNEGNVHQSQTADEPNPPSHFVQPELLGSPCSPSLETSSTTRGVIDLSSPQSSRLLPTSIIATEERKNSTRNARKAEAEETQSRADKISPSKERQKPANQRQLGGPRNTWENLWSLDVTSSLEDSQALRPDRK